MSKITTKLFARVDLAAASTPISSDPPFDFSFAKRASLVVRINNRANVDNIVTAVVSWGARKRGLLNNDANLTWVEDAPLTIATATGGAIGTPIAAVLPIPQMKSKFMKVVFTVSGTTAEGDVEAWLEQETEI